jgi:3-isopropylmalate dehydrogenase
VDHRGHRASICQTHLKRETKVLSYKLLLLPGDGIGPEVIAEVEKILGWLQAQGIARFEIEHGLVGGAAYDAHGKPISDADVDYAQSADAVLFGAIGGPKWADVPFELRPEAGLLRLRKDLALYANLRPAICYPALADASSLKRELVEGLDIMILRELTGGVYFGEPKQIIDLGNGQKRGIDTQVYDTFEIERAGRVAFELARKRRNKVTSSEKRNVMLSGLLWHEVTTALHKREFPDVELEHQLADSLAMQLVRAPKQFDVILTDNLFGDILSDVAAMLTGSLGMLPSASLGDRDAKTGKRKALFEPVHGSAPDIAGRGIANPIAMIGSLGMALRYALDRPDLADAIDAAIAAVLGKGLRTPDIAGPGTSPTSTSGMSDAILAELQAAL